MPASSHKAIRTCLGCMRPDAQTAMVRLASVGGRVLPDGSSRQPGRGGYLHDSPECLVRFERSKVREFRSLRLRLGLNERREITELIRSRLATATQLD
jgi:predicted RNA-binding protein YlxR (DUF448 family)